ncbi:MAG: alpha/beta fold hydrolase [Actinobacteria bacterium]|nr:alpha/beta fold hydrolase [Actinomycetota bacterium]
MRVVSTIPGSEPFTLESGPIAVLMIHGFTGSPLSVKPWAEALHREGFTVAVPRLPGHGTHWEEMNRTQWRDWYGEVVNTFIELRKKHARVFVAGFSMGGALAIHLAAEHGEKIEGLILVNPSVHDRRPIMKLVPVLKHLIPSLSGRGTDVSAPNPPRHSYGRTPLKALSSLQDLWRTVQNELSSIDLPLMIGYSINDHVVDPANAETVIDNIASVDIREVIFERSFHNVALDHDLELLVESSLTFITDVLSGDIGGGNDERDLIDAEFEEIVAGLERPSLDYLDHLENIEAMERYEGDNKALPTLSKTQRAALIAVIAGPLYAIAVRFFRFDLLGLGIWPGLLALLGGVGLFFWQIRPEADDDDGVAL